MPLIRDLQENDIIQQYFNRGVPPGEDMVGIGDDCAVYPFEKREGDLHLVTTDALIENTHFVRDKIKPEDLGYKAVAVNLSDIAAMGGTPTGLFVSIALPGKLEQEWLQRVSDGLIRLAQDQEVPILGGDTTRSKQAVYISITVTGCVKKDRIKYRSGSRKGDAVCVTGTTGDASAGAKLELDPDVERSVDRKTASLLRQRHYRPPILTANGAWLGSRSEVRAMMDLSDGLASDLPGFINDNELGINILREKLPLSDELQSFTQQTRFAAYQLAEDGGEDYQLALTVHPDKLDLLQADYRERFGDELIEVGRVTADHSDLIITQNGQQIRKNPAGFQHFSS